MDTEFVNAFIAKQRDMIGELVNRNLVLETTVQLLEHKLKAAHSEVEALQTEQAQAKQTPSKAAK